MKKPSEMSFGELRKFAMTLKVDTSGVKQPDLLRAVEKAIAAQSGKGTPADPNPKAKAAAPSAPATTPKERPAPAAKEDAPTPEGRAKAAAPAETGGSMGPAIKKIDELTALIGGFEERVEKLESFGDEVRGIIGGFSNIITLLGGAIVAVAEAVGEEGSEAITKVKDLVAGGDGSVGNETLEISDAALDKMEIEELKTLGATLNAKKKAGIDLDVKSARVLRERIKKWLASHAEDLTVDEANPTAASGTARESTKKPAPAGEVEEETEAEEEEEEEVLPECPFKVDEAVEVDFGEEGWKKGKVLAIYVEQDGENDAESCDVEIEEDEAVVGAAWTEMRAFKAKTKVKVKAK